LKENHIYSDDEQPKRKPKKQRERKNYTKYKNTLEDEAYVEWMESGGLEKRRNGKTQNR
jgi:hypothetical protein